MKVYRGPYQLQVAGLAGPDDQALTGTVRRFAGDRLSAVETVNNAKTQMQARKRLAGAPIDRASLVAAGMDINAV